MLLFDLDGTLLLTGGAGSRALHRAGRAIFGERFSFDGVVISGGLDPLLYAEAASRSAIEDAHLHHERFHSLYLEALAEELEHGRDGVRVLPGIEALLGRLNGEAGITLGLVTGNYRRAAPLKLRAAGIAPEIDGRILINDGLAPAGTFAEVELSAASADARRVGATGVV